MSEPQVAPGPEIVAVPPVLAVSDLTVSLPGAARRVVDGLSLSIAPGESVGLVGESGSGKSVASRAMLGSAPRGMRVAGRLRVNGIDLDLGDAAATRRWRAAKVGVIFQDPSVIMDPTRTVGDFLTEVLVLERGVRKAEARQRAVEMLRAMGLDHGTEVLDRYPHEFSGGQLQRICIAAALLPEPELLIADEPTTALDSTSQALVVALLDRARRERGLSLLFITHNLELALAFCDRIAVAYAGKLVEIGSTADIAVGGHHPYTGALLACQPEVAVRRESLPAIPGQPPGLDVAVSGCVFRNRCPLAAPACASPPPWVATAPDAGFACIRPDGGRDDERGEPDAA